jgi:hypothetical protein
VADVGCLARGQAALQPAGVRREGESQMQADVVHVLVSQHCRANGAHHLVVWGHNHPKSPEAVHAPYARGGIYLLCSHRAFGQWSRRRICLALGADNNPPPTESCAEQMDGRAPDLTPATVLRLVRVNCPARSTSDRTVADPVRCPEHRFAMKRHMAQARSRFLPDPPGRAGQPSMRGRQAGAWRDIVGRTVRWRFLALEEP